MRGAVWRAVPAPRGTPPLPSAPRLPDFRCETVLAMVGSGPPADPSKQAWYDSRAGCYPKGREHSSMNRLIAPCALAIGVSLALTACDPYDPGERALGGAAIGAGSGAAIGAAVGGGHGAAVGALVGGAVGAVTGAATTPPPPPPPRAYYGYVYPPPPLPPPPPTPPPAVYYNPY